MNKMILALCVIAAVNAQLTFSTTTQCSCGQLTTQADCALQYPICTWSSSSCSTTSCGSLTSQANCASNLNCMWKDNSCTSFTFCNQLSGTNQKDCFEKSQNCPASDGTTCGSTESLKSCSSFTTDPTCNGYLSSDGLCFWNSSGVCVVASQCSQFNSNTCTNTRNACVWSTTSTSCVAATCGQFYNADTCTNYVTALNSRTFALCTWNSSTSLCVAAPSATSLSASNCYSNTRYTYRWVADSSTCKACYGMIIQMAILTILAIMI